MPDGPEESPPPKRPNPQLERFIRAFEAAVETGDRNEKAADAIIQTIVHEQNGLIPAVDELIDEVRGLREDLRAVAAAEGMRVLFPKMRKL